MTTYRATEGTVFSDRDLRKFDEAISAQELAAAKERANDDAFRVYIHGEGDRSAASLAASARNRERAFQAAAADADRAWFGVERRLLTEAIDELRGRVIDFNERAEALRSRRDELTADATNLSAALEGLS